MSSSPPHCSWHWHWVWGKTWNIFSYSHHAQIMWRLNCKNLFSIWISFSTEQTLQYFPRICKETFLIFGGNQDSVTLSVELLCYAGASPLTPTVVDLSDNRRECGDNTGHHWTTLWTTLWTTHSLKYFLPLKYYRSLTSYRETEAKYFLTTKHFLLLLNSETEYDTVLSHYLGFAGVIIQFGERN